MALINNLSAGHVFVPKGTSASPLVLDISDCIRVISVLYEQYPYLWYEVDFNWGAKIPGKVFIDKKTGNVLCIDPATGLITTNPKNNLYIGGPTNDPQNGAVFYFNEDNSVSVWDASGWLGNTMRVDVFDEKLYVNYLQPGGKSLIIEETEYENRLVPGTQSGDFSYIDFINLDFSKMDSSKPLMFNKQSGQINQCNFTGLKIANSKIENCDFKKNNFFGGTLENVYIENCSVDETSFHGIKIISSSFINIDFTSLSDITALTLVQSSTSNIDFTGSTISFEMIGLLWEYLNLTKTTILNLPADLDLSNLKANNAVLDFMDLNGAKIKNGSFQNSSLKGVNLSGTILSGSNFSQAVLGSDERSEGANLSYAQMNDVTLFGAILVNVDMACVELYGSGKASVAESTMDLINLSGAFLAGLDFSNVKSMKGANFTGACLVNSNFSMAILDAYEGSMVKLDGAALQGADFTGATLSSVSLVNAALSVEKGKITLAKIYFNGKWIKDFDWPYSGATLLTSEQTSHYVVCPIGNTGPCSEKDLLTPQNQGDSPVQKWPASSNSRFTNSE